MTTITPTIARKQFFQIPSLVIDDSEEVIVSFKDGDVAMVDAREYERMKETIYVLQDPVVAMQLRDLDDVSTRDFSLDEEQK